MKKLTLMKAAIAMFAAMAVVSPANAQRREHERERFHTPHWVLDDRFHHNHYYPVPGYSITVLPGGHTVVNFRGGRYFYHSGVWFQTGGPGYVVVRPPVGVVVPVLPPAYTTVWVAGVPYYYANDAYYVSTPNGYVVAEPPMNVAAAPPMQQMPQQAPQAGPASPASGTWYYCESSRTYYPYANECKEGWKSVPASPPPGR